MSVHEGGPSWNGNETTIDLCGCLLPFNEQLGPVLLLIEGCDDYFCPVFSTEAKLRSHMTQLKSKGLTTPYKIKKIDHQREFMDSLREAGVRIMFDPQIISDHHTKWHEVVYDGEQWKFQRSES